MSPIASSELLQFGKGDNRLINNYFLKEKYRDRYSERKDDELGF